MLFSFWTTNRMRVLQRSVAHYETLLIVMKLEETMVQNKWEGKEQESNSKYKESKVHREGSFLSVTHSAPEPTGLSWLTCFEL